MRAKKSWITCLSLAAAALVIALAVIHYEVANYGKDSMLLLHFISDGFFVPAVLYLGFGVMTFISEAGNFYGMQYLGYTLVYLFSFMKSHEDKKDYFTYCLEKQEKQKMKKSPSVKWILILIGGICLAISLLSAALYYRQFHGGL